MCEECFHDSRRMTLDWKTKTTPMRALKRRKLADMVVILKEGLSARALGLVLWSCFEDRSSVGITCCRSLS